jgi:hypothetical protein
MRALPLIPQPLRHHTRPHRPAHQNLPLAHTRPGACLSLAPSMHFCFLKTQIFGPISSDETQTSPASPSLPKPGTQFPTNTTQKILPGEQTEPSPAPGSLTSPRHQREHTLPKIFTRVCGAACRFRSQPGLGLFRQVVAGIRVSPGHVCAGSPRDHPAAGR